MANEDSATWVPADDENAEPDREMHPSRRVLLFHIAAILDIKERFLEFMGCNKTQRFLHEDIVRYDCTEVFAARWRAYNKL